MTLLRGLMKNDIQHNLLKGLIDLHVHASPDYVPRKLSVYELAVRAKEAGFNSVVIKSHHYPTVALARLVSEISRMRVLGGITLNESVGGFNVKAVEVAMKMGGRIVWMPTIDSWNHRHFYGKGGGLSLLTVRGEIRKEVEEILELIASSKVILATGHLSPSEIELLVREASRIGIEKILVNHPMWGPTFLTPSQQVKLADMGAYLEFTLYALTPIGGSLHVKKFVEMIRHVGPEHCIISSDLGQPENPDPVEAWLKYLKELLKYGISESELEVMIKHNPSQLIN